MVSGDLASCSGPGWREVTYGAGLAGGDVERPVPPTADTAPLCNRSAAKEIVLLLTGRTWEGFGQKGAHPTRKAVPRACWPLSLSLALRAGAARSTPSATASRVPSLKDNGHGPFFSWPECRCEGWSWSSCLRSRDGLVSGSQTWRNDVARSAWVPESRVATPTPNLLRPDVHVRGRNKPLLFKSLSFCVSSTPDLVSCELMQKANPVRRKSEPLRSPEAAEGRREGSGSPGRPDGAGDGPAALEHTRPWAPGGERGPLVPYRTAVEVWWCRRRCRRCCCRCHCCCFVAVLLLFSSASPETSPPRYWGVCGRPPGLLKERERAILYGTSRLRPPAR